MHQKDAASRKRGPNVWVIRYRGQYSVKEEGHPGYLVPPVPQRVAIGLARLIARINGSELIIQGEHGRIRARDSHGADPYLPKG
jgi:hypothetical protein